MPDETAILAADVVALATREDGQLCVLLIRRGDEPFADCWALPGGHVNAGEQTIAAARREFWEETGLHANGLTEVGVYADPDRDPRGRVVSFAYITTLAGKPPAPTIGDEASDAIWWPLSELAGEPLAFDHRRVLFDALQVKGGSR